MINKQQVMIFFMQVSFISFAEAADVPENWTENDSAEKIEQQRDGNAILDMKVSPGLQQYRDAFAHKEEQEKTESLEDCGGQKPINYTSLADLQSLYRAGMAELPEPYADAEKIEPELVANVLMHCPEKIKRLVKKLKEYTFKWNEQCLQYPSCFTAADYLRVASLIKPDMGSMPFPQRKLLICGPAGTGKTTLGKAIAIECGMSFFCYSGAGISNAYKNSGVVNLERIFARAASLNKPCIIMIDEFAELFTQYGNRFDTEGNTLPRLWQLLDQYAGYPILFIGTANDLEAAPAPIKDRFKSYTVNMELPGELERRKLIFYYMMRKHNIVFKEKKELVLLLAAKTAGLSHRCLIDLIDLAVELKSDGQASVTKKDCLNALSEIEKANKKFDGGFRKQFIEWGNKWHAPISCSVTLIGMWINLYGMYQNYQVQQWNAALRTKEGQAWWKLW